MYAIKWKEPVVSAVRRIAREQCDTLVLAERPGGSGPVGVLHVDEVQRNVRRGLSLLAAVGPLMDPPALRRERSALRRAARGLARLESDDDVAAASRPRAMEAVNAALRDVRMRAGYWHLNADGFDALRPGLGRVYGAARRRVRSASLDERLTDEGRGLLAEALWGYADALKLVERAWPELLKAERRRVRGLAEALTGESADEAGEQLAEAAAWMSETPGRWCDRVAGYWAAWRGGLVA
ncbi:MAG: hypothetical protein AAGE65_07940 [Planctomycetota bacterium]